MNTSTRRVAVLGGNRIPFARSNSAYADASNQDMLTAAIDGLVTRYRTGGRTARGSRGWCRAEARPRLQPHPRVGARIEAVARDTGDRHPAGLRHGAAGCDRGVQQDRLGQIDVGIAGGTDTTSDAPVAISDKLRKKLMKVNAARDTASRIKALGAIRPGDIGLEIPQNGEPRTRLSMGDHAALTALEWQIGREEQDELAAASHQHLAAAYDRGFFDDQITPFRGLERDNNLRADSSAEKLAKLKPVFGKGEAATMTAGNSTPLTDGASVVLLSSDDWAKEHGLEPLAYLVDSETAAVDYVHGGEGLLMAPAYAVPRMLARNGLTLQDFDFYEIHEAFASQVLVHPEGVGGPGVLQGAPRPRRPARLDRPRQAERQWILACGRTPVRGHWWPDRERLGQGARREGLRSRPDLDLCGRWPGRGRDPRAPLIGSAWTPRVDRLAISTPAAGAGP